MFSAMPIRQSVSLSMGGTVWPLPMIDWTSSHRDPPLWPQHPWYGISLYRDPPQSTPPPPTPLECSNLLLTSRWFTSYWNVFLFFIFTACKRSLGQGNIFTPACHSVHRGGLLLGGCLVPGGLLSGRCLVETPPDGYCCGRYASYWNAFLFWWKNTENFNTKAVY